MTDPAFVVPRNQNAHALRVGLDVQRAGWQASVWGSYARRDRLAALGLWPDVSAGRRIGVRRPRRLSALRRERCCARRRCRRA